MIKSSKPRINIGLKPEGDMNGRGSFDSEASK